MPSLSAAICGTRAVVLLEYVEMGVTLPIRLGRLCSVNSGLGG